MNRTDIINYYLSKCIQPTFYLELGVASANINFNLIEASNKDGVDPNGSGNFNMKSDDFFKRNQVKYDIIFIDGDHSAHQVCRDIANSLESLKPNGRIIMHDCNPTSYEIQSELPPQNGSAWTGTVWKAYMKYRRMARNMEMFVIDTDWGVGIINPQGKQDVFVCPEDIYDYNVFDKYRKKALNLISVEEWLKIR